MLKVCSVFPSGKGYTREGDLKQTSLTTESRLRSQRKPAER